MSLPACGPFSLPKLILRALSREQSIIGEGGLRCVVGKLGQLRGLGEEGKRQGLSC